jgi:hypothetical protein
MSPFGDIHPIKVKPTANAASSFNDAKASTGRRTGSIRQEKKNARQT